MIKHIVLWKLDGSYSADEKDVIKKAIQAKLLALKDTIEVANSIKVFFNDERALDANADVILDSDFDTLQALSDYQVHPEHKKVGEYLKSVKLQRSAIDYQY